MQALAPFSFPLSFASSVTDLQALGLFASLLFSSVMAGEGLRVLGWAPESSRRAVHVGVGLTTAASPWWFSGPELIYALAVAFVAGNAVALALGWFPSMHAIERRSWGTVVFPIALIAALFLCWGERVWAMQIAFAVLALADPAASWVGTRVDRHRQSGGEKSWAGSLAFAVVAFGITVVGLGLLTEATAEAVVVGSLSVACLATVAEALGRRGWDNLWIVLAVLVALRWWEGPPAGTLVGLSAIGAALAFAVLTWRAGVLTATGALAGSLLAWGLVVEWRMGWWAPALTFFVLSSALSLVGKRRKASAEAQNQKGSRRDAAQVMANGGVGIALLAATWFAPGTGLYGLMDGGPGATGLFDVRGLLYGAFVGAFSAAAADTWGTEIGTWVRGRTRWLGVGREISPGTSGGMSLAGTLGGLSGAVFVVLAASLVASRLSVEGAVALVAAGVFGAFVDTVLGATLQARYRLPDGSLTEKPVSTDSASGAEVALPLAAGVRGVDNDVVNWACTLAGALGGAAAWMLLS